MPIPSKNHKRMFSNVKEKVKQNVRKAAVSVTKLNRTLTTSLGRTTDTDENQLPPGVKLFEMEGAGDMLRRCSHYSVHAALPPNFFQEVQQSGESIEEGIEEVWFPLEEVADRVGKRREKLREIVGTTRTTASEAAAESSSVAASSVPTATELAQKNAALLAALTAKLQSSLQLAVERSTS